MTGIVLLIEGVIEANLPALNSRFHLPLEPLMAMKAREQAEVSGDDSAHQSGIMTLFERLEAAREQSPLPEDVPNRAAINDFLVRLRVSS